MRYFCTLVFVFLFISISSSAQVKKYTPREIVDAGNGLKIEILDCRGEGESRECDVIYYTTKRQEGKRVWEKLSKIREQQRAAKEAKLNPAKSVLDTIINVVPAVPVIMDSVVTTPKTKEKKKKITPAEKKKVLVEKKNVKQEVPVDTTASNKIKTPVIDSFTVTPDPARNLEQKVLNSVNPVLTYTLDQCFQLALLMNNSIKKARNNVEQSILDNRAAKFNLLPSVSYNLGHYFSFGKNIDPVTNNYVNETFSGGYTGLNMQLQLFSGFSKLNTIKQSGYIKQSAEASKRRSELELLTNITLTYAKLLLCKEQLAASYSSMQSTGRQLEIINEKIKVGRLTRYEAYAFTSRLNTEQANIITIQNDSAIALQDLKQLLNLDYKHQIDIARIDSIDLQKILNTSIYANDFIDTVLRNHPAIVEARMNQEVALLGLKIAKANKYPSLSVGGNVSSNYNVDQYYPSGSKIPLGKQLDQNLGENINLSLRIPIFTQLQNANQIKKQQLNISNAQIDASEAENTVVKNTLQLINDFNSSRQKYVATLSARDNSLLSFSMYEEKYKLGQISSLEVLTARDNLNNAVSQYLQAKLELFFRYQLLLLLKTS